MKLFLKSLGLGLGFGIILVSCANFSYVYYTIDSKNGKLLAKDSKDDLAMSVCDPTEANKAPCVAMMEQEFFKMRRDYIDVSNRLEACEQK